MNKILRYIFSSIVAIALVAGNYDLHAQCNTGCWNGWANSGSPNAGVYTPGCTVQSFQAPSTGYTYINLIPGKKYTYYAAPGSGWTTPYVEAYYYNTACNTWICQAGGEGSISFTASNSCGDYHYLVVVRNGNSCAPSWPGTSATLYYQRVDEAALTSSQSAACQGSCSASVSLGISDPSCSSPSAQTGMYETFGTASTQLSAAPYNSRWISSGTGVGQVDGAGQAQFYGADDWGRGFMSSGTVARADGATVQGRYYNSGSYTMMGWHDAGTAVSYTNLVYAFYPYAGGGLNIYESGNYVGDFTSAAAGIIGMNKWIDFKIVLRAGGGADYYLRNYNAGEAWRLIYRSAYSTATNLRAGASVYSSCCWFYLDDMYVSGVTQFPATTGLCVGSGYTYGINDQYGNVGVGTANIVVSDATAPTYNGVSIAGANYVSGNTYYVKSGTNFTVNVSHSDNCATSTQYLEFTKDNTNVGGWSAPNIKSYANPNGVAQNGAYNSFVDGVADNTLLDITQAVCQQPGGCSSTANGAWAIATGAGASGNYGVTVYMYDGSGNGVGYTQSGLFVYIDNTAPNINTPTTSNTGSNAMSWTVVASTDGQSGMNASGYEWQWSYDNSSWNAWTTTGTSVSGTWACNRTVYVRVRSKDNVGNVSAWSTSGVAGSLASTNTLAATVTNVSYNGACDGSIVITPSGGTAPYTYSEFSYGFGGTTVSTSLFTKDASSYYTQNNQLDISGPDNGWDKYLFTNQTFARQTGKTFSFRYFNGSGNWSMIGWHGNGNTSTNRYENLLYGLYFHSGGLNIYEDGNSRGDFTANVGGGWAANTWYDCKIILKASGADYYVKTAASSTYGLIYSSTYSTESDLRLGVTYLRANLTSTDDWNVYGGTPSVPNPTYSLCPGQYTYAMTDANGCPATVTATVTEPSALSLSPAVTNESCPGACNGSVVLSGSGGVSPYSFAGASEMADRFSINDEGLILHLTMDGGANDRSPAAQPTGTNNGGVTFANGVADFSGGAKSLSMGTKAAPYLTAATTISFWINSYNVASPNRQNPFDQAYGGWGTMTLEPDGSISWFYGNNGGNGNAYGSHASPAGTVTAGSWIHIVAVRDPGSKTYNWYKNGTLILSGSYDATYPVIASGALTIGSGYTGNSINAQMEDFRIYNRALSAGEVNKLYNRSLKDYFYTGGVVTTSDGVVKFNNETDTWDFNFYTTQTYARTAGRTFQGQIYNTGSYTMLGWHDGGSNASSYANLVYALYFQAGGALNIYESGASIASVGTYALNTWYDFKIELLAAGAKYYIKLKSASAWTLVYTSASSSATNLRPGITPYGTASVYTDNWMVTGPEPLTTNLCPGAYGHSVIDASGGITPGTATIGTSFSTPSIAITSGGNQSICSGASAASFTAAITGGSGCTYQWQSSNDGYTWGNVSGQTSASYSPGVLTKSTFFRCVTLNCIAGCSQASSEERFVAVTPAPTVQTHPAPSSQSVCVGANVSYSAQANLGSGATRYRLVLLSAHGAGWHGLQEIRGFNLAGTEQTLSCLDASSVTYDDVKCNSAGYGAQNAFDGVYSSANASNDQWLTPKNTPAGNTNWQNYNTVNPFFSPEWIEFSSPQPLAEMWVYNGRYNYASATAFKDYYILVSYDNGTTWSKIKQGAMTDQPDTDGNNNKFSLEPTYTWKQGATPVGSGKTLTLNSVTTGQTGTYTAELSYGGCSTTATNGAVLTVNPFPTAGITGTTTICSGGSTTLTASGGGTYAWSNGPTTAGNTVSTAGPYTVTVTTNGCTATASATLTVTPLPTAGITGTTTICAGSSTTFTASGGGTYAWSNGPTTAGNTVSAAGPYTVTVTTNGCTATASTTLTVTPLPTAGITGTTAICSGGSTTFTASGGGTYAWSNGPTTAANTVSTAGPYTVTVTANGCTATASTSLTVNANPSTSPSLSAPSACSGSPVTLSANASAGSGTITSYAWSAGLGNVASGTVSPAGTTSYTVTVTNSNGCTAVGGPVTLTINSAPSAAPTVATSSPSASCSNSLPGTITLIASGGNPGTGGTANWYTDGCGTTFLSNGSSPTVVNPGATTTYYVRYENSCGSSACAQVTYTVNPTPTAGITGMTAICSGGSTTLTATGGTSYVWSNGPTTATNTVSSAGTYTVTVTGTGSCTATASATTTISANPSAAPSLLAGTICSGGSTTLSANATAGSGTITDYTWSAGLGNVASGSVNPTNTTSYSVTVTNSNGCTATGGPVTLTVAGGLAVSLAETNGDAGGCSGDAFSLTASGSGGLGTPGYQFQRYISGVWTNTGGNSSNPVFSTGPVVNTGGSDIIASYRVIYTTSGGGCGSGTSNEVDLTVFAKPTAEPEFDDCAAQLAGTKYSYIILSNSGSAPPFHVNDSTNLGAVKMYSDIDTSYLIYRLPQDGSNTEYVFTTTDANGCSVTSTFMRETTYPNTIVTANTSGTTVNECQLRGWNEWEHFQNPNNKDEVIMSVNPKGVDLGKVTVSSYVDAPGISVMNSGSTCTGTAQAAMRRHYKVTSSAFAPGEAFTNGANVGVRLYFSNADFADLSSRAAANDDANNSCTTDDNITDMAELFVTKYSDNTGSGTENGTYADNDPAMGIYKVFGPGRPNSAATYAGPVSAMQANGFDAVFQPQTATGHHYIDLDVTEFSEFWLHGSGSGSPLPVKMLFIEAKGVDNTFIRTSWATSTEIDNWKFEVERSEDGKTFTKIGEVIGHATTTERQDYLYNDLTTRQGVRYYYRLKQIDFDGKYEYTPIVSAILDIDDAFSVGEFVPNPTSGRSTLIFKTKANKEVKAQVVNYLGAVVMEQTKTIRNADNTMYFDFDKLAAGTYMVTLSTADKNYTKRVVLTR